MGRSARDQLCVIWRGDLTSVLTTVATNGDERTRTAADGRPSGRLAAPTSDATVGALAGYPAAPVNPGNALGLQSSLVSIDPTLTPHSMNLKQVGGLLPDLLAQWFSGPDGGRGRDALATWR